MPSPPVPVRARTALAFGLAVLAGVAGCATISSPTGGPVDSTPPSLVAALPADGSTNVTETTLRLAFSERISAASAPRAVRVVPQSGAPPRVRVRGDELEIRFDSLREETTYVVTVGTDLSDERNVKLASPITVAFATGDQIDQGAIAGVVRSPTTGRGVGGLVVLAYGSETPDLTAPADYRTEVGSDGAFRLSYLRPDSFLVFALEDRNRNGLADAGERYAAPVAPRTASVSAADSTASVPQLDLWVTAQDTVPPEPRRVRTISDRRFAVRLDEPVALLRPQLDGDWALSDSASARPTPVLAYQDPVQPAEIRFLAAQPLTESPHVIRLLVRDAVADSAGNELAPFQLTFEPSATADTLQARVTGFLNGGPLRTDSTQAVRADEPVGLRYSSPPDLDVVSQRIELVTAAGRPIAVAFERTPDGLGVRVLPDSTQLPSSFRLQLRGDSTVTRSFAPLGRDDLGALVGTVPGAAGRPVIVEVTLDDGTVRSAPVDGDGAFAFGGLAPGPVRVRLFEDLNGDGHWSGGRLPPDSVPPEPLVVVQEPAAIRARWDTEIEASRLVLFPDSP